MLLVHILSGGGVEVEVVAHLVLEDLVGVDERAQLGLPEVALQQVSQIELRHSEVQTIHVLLRLKNQIQQLIVLFLILRFRLVLLFVRWLGRRGLRSRRRLTRLKQVRSRQFLLLLL